MKLNRRITLISVATLLAVSPGVGLVNPTNSVIAAARTRTVTLRYDAQVYYANGRLNWKAGLLYKGRTYRRYSNQIRIGKHYYYCVGKNRYIRSSNVGQIDGKSTLTLDYNSKLYNNRGRKWRLPSLKKNNAYRYYGTKTIKGVKYYRVGRNQYIKAANVAALNGNQIYVDQTYVTLKRNTTSFTADGDANNTSSYKRGQKVSVDQYIYIPASYDDDWTAANDDYPVAFYRIKGQKDAYLPQLYVTARKAMKPVYYADLHNTFITLTATGDMPIYNVNGEATSVVMPHASTNVSRSQNVDRLMYLWVAKDNQAELFYHLKSAEINTPAGDVYRLIDVRHRMDMGNGFVKASDAKYTSGIKLTPVNTKAEAEADAKVATASEKSALTAEIAKSSQVKASDAYKLTTRDKREAYDYALSDAQKIAQDSSATGAAVKIVTWSLQQRASELDGKKVVVANLQKLTADERAQIERVAQNALDTRNPRYNWDCIPHFTDHNTKLVARIQHWTSSIHGQNNLLSDTTETLNISDYAEQGK